MFSLASSLRVSPLRVALSSRPNFFQTQLRFVTKRVYVGGLPPDYTDDDIRALISKYEIKNLRTPRFEGKTKGFCFIDVDGPLASDVVSTLKGIVINDSVITAELAIANPSSRRLHSIRTSSGGNASPPAVTPGYTSLYVGNLPWSADERRIATAFESKKEQVGQVRIPKDHLNRSKGYAFVEIKNEAVDDVIPAVEGYVMDGRAIRVGRSNQANNSSNSEPINRIPPPLELNNE